MATSGELLSRRKHQQLINTIVPDDTVQLKYLFYYLRTIRQRMENETSATTVVIINKTKFSSAPIRLPPAI
ncbi:restriction endonuclease subunit S [Marinomonas phaeophyticola]|uniref:restriction endonuclease subunit S n=1 Tax=Marinomonas phaeophyticola TaxID=3004091 RepID=UPI003D181C80